MAESAYTRAIARYREALRSALELADDPFKAPELNVYESKHVVEAAWDMQVEYAAMKRKGEGGGDDG